MTSEDVIGVLERLKKTRGAPEYIRSDNGPEFVARSRKDWMQSKAIGTHYSERAVLGKTPMQRASTPYFVRRA